MCIAVTLSLEAFLHSKRRPLQKITTGYNAKNNGLVGAKTNWIDQKYFLYSRLKKKEYRKIKL